MADIIRRSRFAAWRRERRVGPHAVLEGGSGYRPVRQRAVVVTDESATFEVTIDVEAIVLAAVARCKASKSGRTHLLGGAVKTKRGRDYRVEEVSRTEAVLYGESEVVNG